MATPAEIADRIAKNRLIDQRIGMTLNGIVARLNANKQRATYAAVAEVLGVPPLDLMKKRTKCPSDSWIVAGKNRAAGTKREEVRRGWPTGYATHQIHPDCLRQATEGNSNIIETAEALKLWLSEVR
jgi:hypothetical protein